MKNKIHNTQVDTVGSTYWIHEWQSKLYIHKPIQWINYGSNLIWGKKIRSNLLRRQITQNENIKLRVKTKKKHKQKNNKQILPYHLARNRKIMSCDATKMYKVKKYLCIFYQHLYSTGEHELGIDGYSRPIRVGPIIQILHRFSTQCLNNECISMSLIR